MSSADADIVPNRVFLLLAGSIGLWLLWDSIDYRLVTYSIFADYWEHSAALKAWLSNLASPGNPHVADDSSSARYVPAFLLLVFIGRPLGLDALDLMAVSAVLNYVVLVGGIRLFFSAYFRNPWAAPVAFVVMLSFWGVPWIWSNLYELRSLFMTASYPSTLAFGLALISLWVTLRFMNGRIAFFGGLLALLLLSAMMFITHALTGVFAICACGLLAFTERGAAFGQRVFICIVLLAGTLLAGLWPWFSVWDVILASSERADDRTWQTFTGLSGMLDRARSGIWQHMFYNPREALIALGPALLGVPAALYLLLRRRYLLIPLGAALMLAPFILNVFVQIALAHRFLLYAVFFLHMATVWAVLKLFTAWREEQAARSRSVAIGIAVGVTRVLVVVLAAGHVALLWGDYQGAHLDYRLTLVEKRRALPVGYDAPRLYNELTACLNEDSVVLGPRRLTWPLPTFKGKVVALPEDHENSLISDQGARVRDVEHFLDDGTAGTERAAVIAKYAATHVLVNMRNAKPGLISWLDGNAQTLVTVERYRMYTLGSAAVECAPQQAT